MKLNIEKEVGKLQLLPTAKLIERFASVFGEPTRSRNRTHLIRKIAWKLQVLQEGDLSERARKRADTLAQGSELRVMMPKTNLPPIIAEPIEAEVDPRLPAVGTALVRKYKGRILRVLVLENGFEFEGEHYQSLSALAKKITGSHVNGFHFFQLEGKP